MKKRATITIDPEVHARARRLARRRKTTVSGLIESLLASEGRGGGSLVEGMLGSAALREAPAGQDALLDALKSKYAR